ncbi:MAG: Bax inhibitor-1 family protein [Alloprevotella sp.]
MNNPYGYDPMVEERSSSIAFPALMSKVYLWMMMALVMTGLTAFIVAGNESLVYLIVSNRVLFFGLMIAELALVGIVSAGIMSISFPVAGVLFAAYSILNGFTLSVILLAYTETSVATTFFVTAGTFGVMSLTGLFIKRDLSRIGRFLFMALIGLIVATLANYFLKVEGLAVVLNYIGVLIFCGLTAYDTQKMKEILAQSQDVGDESAQKIALLCSLSLYLDFVNLFLYLLRFLGNKK